MIKSANKQALALGQKMRDRVSGFEGIAEIRADFMTGNTQYTLTTKEAKGEDSKSRAFDVFQLEAASVKPVIDAIAPPADTGIELGEKVKDVVTQIEGVATIKNTFLNGCVYYTVVLEYKAKEYVDFFFEYKRLKKVSAGVKAAIEQRSTTAEKPTGGPAYKVPMRG